MITRRTSAVYALEGELEEEGLIQCNDLVIFRAAGLLPTIGKKDRYSRGESQAGQRELHAHAKHKGA